MSALPERTWTPEDYLAYEREGEVRHDYLDGKIYALAGASANHNLVVGNALASLHSQLRQRPCRVFPSDMRLKVSRTGLYTYPDITIVCGELRFEDEQHDTLLNPTVIVEVLSPSTEAFDRGKKLDSYRTILSLQECVLIAQDECYVYVYTRQPDKGWLLTEATERDQVVELVSINCQLPLTEVYRKVEFQPHT